MKKIYRIAFITVLAGLLVGCENQKWEFPDYKYTTTYFPYQTPVRTLVLGDYDDIDNTKDNNHQFSIGVAVGGMYDNKSNIQVQYVLDENLSKNLYTSDGDSLFALPQSYYSLSPIGTMTVPKGMEHGFIDVKLNDAFFNDPNSFRNYYILPLRITSSQTDSILEGKALIPNADPRINSEWSIVPKNYTLFGIKFINPYHGKYLHRGKTVVTDASMNTIDQVIYRNKFIERNDVVFLKTIGKNDIEFPLILRRTSGSPGTLNLKLSFNDSNSSCTVSLGNNQSGYSVNGTGSFIRQGDEWGGKKRNTLTLNYKIEDISKNEFYSITDTLVMRDRAVTLETFTQVIK